MNLIIDITFIMTQYISSSEIKPKNYTNGALVCFTVQSEVPY